MTDRYERRIFRLEQHESFQDFIDDKARFGWRYVKQTPRSRTVSARHSGGGYGVGSAGFFTSGFTKYQTEFWSEVELARDRFDANYATFVECERALGVRPQYPVAPRTFRGVAMGTWIALNAITVGWSMLAAIVGALFFPTLNRWVEATTSGVSLTVYILALMASFALPALAWAIIQIPALRRERQQYESDLAAVVAERDQVRSSAERTMHQVTRGDLV